MDFQKPQALNESLIESDSDEDNRGSTNSKLEEVSLQPEPEQAKPSIKQEGAPQQRPKPVMQFKPEGKFSFYYKQLEKIHSSGINIVNVDPTDIVKQLIEKGETLKKESQMDIRDRLKMIKVDQVLMPTLFASEMNEQINNQKEIKSNNDLKRFLYSKQNAQNKLLVEELQKYPTYNDQNHFLNFKPTQGKSIDLVENCNGQKFIICKFIDADGTHLKIFNFELESGTIGTEVLREQITGDVNKDLDKINEDEDHSEDEDDKVNQILQLNDKSKLKELFQNVAEIKQYNIFNKIWTKHNENIYFFKVVNDHDEFVSHIKLVKFNLLTLKQADVLKGKIEKEDTEIHTIHDEDKLEITQPFGVSQISFQDSPNSHNIEGQTDIEEQDFLDKQFCMVLNTNFNAFSLRKVNDLGMNIFYFENDSNSTTWTLFMHDDNVKKLNYPFTIGSINRCKTYKTMVSGSLAHDVGNSHWTCNLHDVNNPHLEQQIEHRFTQKNHKIYISRLNQENKIEFNQRRMVDIGNKKKIKFMKIHKIEAQQNATNNYMKMLYMNNEFNLDTFMILQDQQTDKTYLFFSALTDSRLRVIQMKTNLTSVVCKPWDYTTLNPVTKLQYFKATKGATLQQVHHNFYDVVNNGQFLTNEKRMEFSKMIKPQFRRTCQPPKYFEEFFGLEGPATKFANQRPSNIFQSKLDDRRVVPRLGIKNIGKNTVTYIKAVNSKSGQKVGAKSMHTIRVNSLQADKKTRQLINSMKHFGWEEINISLRSMNTSMQPSTSIECMNESQAKFKQNWQVCVLSYNQLVINIYEYQLIWYEEGGEENHVLDCQMNYIGRKLILLKEPFQVFKKINFLPYYPNQDDLVITGTQLVPETDQKSDFQHFIFLNSQPEDIQFKTDLSLCSFKQYVNTTRQMVGFMINCQINPKSIHIYSNQEKDIIFDLQQRVISNMVMNKDIDVDSFVETVIEKTEENHNHDKLDKIEADIEEAGLQDMFAPLEVLNCQSMLDYLQNSPNILSKLLLEQSDQTLPINSMIQQLIESVDEEKRQEYQKSLQASLPEKFIRQYQAISDDLFFNNPIFRCFEDLTKRRKSCQKLIQLSLDAPCSTWIHSRMMQILPMIVKHKSEFEEYGYFFQDYDGRDEKTTFAIKMLDLDLPDYADKSENLRFLMGAELSQNFLRDAKTQIQGEDDKIEGEKSVMVHHFLIDFSKTILAFKIRHELDDTSITNLGIKKGEKMTKYDMQYYIYRVSRKYGKTIEQCDTIRAIIDDQFFSETQGYFNKMFAYFVCFFLLPFLTQIFVENQIFVNAAIGTSLLLVAHTIYVKLAFVKVVGITKFLKNVQNSIDVILVIVYILYTILRFIHVSALPNPSNVTGPNQPTVTQGASIFFNFSITILIIIKLMLMIRINQTFSQLAELVIVCIRDVIPFLIFLITWIFIFCLLYKVLGAQQNVEASYLGIHPFFGYFFYTFENSIGNISLPTYEIWANIIKNPIYAKDELTFGYIFAKTMIYMIYGVWFLNQYFIFILLLNFLIAVISQSYADVMANANISQYKQRAELNRECLIRSKAFGQDKEINVMVLSADTLDESLESKWFTFLQTIRKLLSTTSQDFEENVQEGQEKLVSKIDQVQQELQQEMKEQNEVVIKMVKKIIQTQENAQNVRNQVQQQLRNQIRQAQQKPQGQRLGAQSVQQSIVQGRPLSIGQGRPQSVQLSQADSIASTVVVRNTSVNASQADSIAPRTTSVNSATGSNADKKVVKVIKAAKKDDKKDKKAKKDKK